MNDVAVTGIGVICAGAKNPDELWRLLLKGTPTYKSHAFLEAEQFSLSWYSIIEDIDCQDINRGKSLALFALKNALNDAEISLPDNWGLYLGSSMGESAAFEKAASGVNLDLREFNTAGISRYVRDQMDTSGKAFAFGTACAAGNYAIGAAAEDLRTGRVDLAIAGGVDPFSRIALAGFSRSRAMSQNGLCLPFDKNRNGMIPGEGACFLVLERKENALARNARIYSCVDSLYLSCDAYHHIAPKPDGFQIKSIFENMFRSGASLSKDIDWICAHGSGTKSSDYTEASVYSEIFHASGIRVSGLKGILGHTLGASSAIEAAICCLAIYKEVIPGSNAPLDPIDMDHLRFIIHPESLKLNKVLNSAFAFGGLNSVLELSKCLN